MNGEQFASGSGVIISDEGLIITNYHVIDHAFSAQVILSDDTKFSVEKIIGYNKDYDMAVIKINAKGLKHATIGDSSKAVVGDYVMAIGNPAGYRNTVSEGIISGIRNEDGCDKIQITAPITHGSSGGGLFNTKGELIGITSSGYGSGNVNFASSINQLNLVLNNPVNISFKDLVTKEYGGKTLNQVKGEIKQNYRKNYVLDTPLYFDDIECTQVNGSGTITIKVIMFNFGYDSFINIMNKYILPVVIDETTLLLENMRDYVKLSFPDKKVNIQLIYKGYSITSTKTNYINNMVNIFYYDKTTLEPIFEVPIIFINEYKNNNIYSFFNYSFKNK
jgi:hypothetical protein